MDGVHFRRFKARDIARVRDMFSEAFKLGTYSDDPFVMRHLLDHYLCAYLGRATYSVVAEENGRALGFLMGTARFDERIGYRLLELYHALFLIFRRAGRVYFRGRRLIERADRSMRRSAPPADCELILFVVDRSARGRGVGREMLRMFRRYLEGEGARTMFLFTDDYSDVGYYRTRGYAEEGVREIRFSPGDEARFYLFSIPVGLEGGANIDDTAQSAETAARL
jgi:ribosomal protein S18 acetylase RimI-like enzyme